MVSNGIVVSVVQKDDAKRKEDANSKADKVKKVEVVVRIKEGIMVTITAGWELLIIKKGLMLFEQAQELSWIVRLCKSRGFGFIEYASHENAQSVIQTMYQQEHHSRKIRVNFATDRSGGLHNCSGDYGGGGGGSGGSSGGGVYGSRSNFDGSVIAGGYGGSGGEYGVTNGGGSDNFFSGSSTVSGGHSQNHPLDNELGTLLTSGRG
ncbi:hypothetical protein IFM89_034970 [Coptis chinensis]|uniref:RRM domain-containing protein n=1 Tax=Coptis chinensis TaxID=261450 RepID=A0A835I8Q3_9MAGN|nr:hypothetical protein IFM89_034970 [Coptis chinensis]